MRVVHGADSAEEEAHHVVLHLTSAYDSSILQHTSAYVSIRQHTSAYVSMRQHASAYVSIRQHTSAYVSSITWQRRGAQSHSLYKSSDSPPAHTSHAAAAASQALAPLCVSIRQHTSAYVIHLRTHGMQLQHLKHSFRCVLSCY